MLVMAELVVSEAVYLVWKVHDFHRLFLLHPLRIVHSSAVLEPSEYRDLPSYVAQIDRTN